MYLDEILAAQKRGEAKGIPSICSAHPYVLRTALGRVKATEVATTPVLIEATCNQVNQFGGYTGMTPRDFVAYVKGIADENSFPFENLILGGDHLGPNVWQNEPAESAMQKADVLVAEYVQAGFVKIHLDCSMKLGDDPAGALDVEIIAQRAARLAGVAEAFGDQNLHYVIGTEVPTPGGAHEHEEGVSVTKVEDVARTINVTRDVFYQQGLQAAWEQVIAVVVQPGVEFGDDFVLGYQPDAAQGLRRFIEGQSLIYEAHSTDYQTRDALTNLVRDHFGILKVGPGLTFAFREAIFALAKIEDEICPAEESSNMVQVLDDTMLKHPEHWKKYYQGTSEEQAFKRKFSMSDRIRYYWGYPEVQQALGKLGRNLMEKQIPHSLLKEHIPFDVNLSSLVDDVISEWISHILRDYWSACGMDR
ncbi:MAG: class II D-tagatose-bisphosphate aldolase, non-catalytic subunit [Chloroflexota bacterium]